MPHDLPESHLRQERHRAAAESCQARRRVCRATENLFATAIGEDSSAFFFTFLLVLVRWEVVLQEAVAFAEDKVGAGLYILKSFQANLDEEFH